MTKEELSKLLDNALIAFWQVVVDQYPEAESGDLSPWQTVRLELAAEAAIKEWIGNNVPKARRSPCER